jgi:hypothetical protein
LGFERGTPEGLADRAERGSGFLCSCNSDDATFKLLCCLTNVRAVRSGLSGTACGEERFCPHGEAPSQQPPESVELRPAARLPVFHLLSLWRSGPVDRPADEIFLVSTIAQEVSEHYGKFLKETLCCGIERIEALTFYVQRTDYAIPLNV